MANAINTALKVDFPRVTDIRPDELSAKIGACTVKAH
jgi:hypothetical protein